MFHIRPWEWDRMRYVDTVQLMRTVDAHRRQVEEQARG